MSKTILAQVDGFTPLIDGVVLDVGIMAAAVFGKAWRYCQMAHGVCEASQDRIANELGISRATVNTCMAILTENKYLEDTTPNLLGLPHIYRDTGKANLSISLTGGCQNSLQGGVKNFDTKKVIKETEDRYSKFTKMIMTLQGGAMNAIDGELISVWIEKHADKWIEMAIDMAKANGAKSAKYVDKILIGWEAGEYPKTREQQIEERKKGVSNGNTRANSGNATNGAIGARAGRKADGSAGIAGYTASDRAAADLINQSMGVS